VKTFKTAYCTQPASRRATFAVTSTATGCAVLLMAATSAARAQTAPAAAAPAGDSIEEVVVTGIRKSIQDSIAAKKNSSSIVEVVSAEDIGKLPDNSIAESLARLPGIAAQRTAGRAQSLSIRGLGPDYTVTTFNGREQPSTSDARSVEFDQYPSELVSQVKIFKTPDAGMSYQGIAGTADIETVKPLAYGKRAASVTYKFEKDGQKSNVPSQSDTGNRASGMYIDQFMDNKVGVALGVAYNKTPYQAQTRESWGYADGPNGTKIVGGNKDGVQSSYFQRTGALAVIEFQPNDRLHSTFDGYHSNFKELQNIRRMEYPLQWGAGTLDPNSIGPVVDNRITSGTYTGVPFVVIENYNNETHANVDAFGLNTDFKLTDNWTLNNDLSYSKAHRNKLRLESTGGDGSGDPGSPLLPSAQTATFVTGGSGASIPTITGNYSDYNTTFLADPGGWAGGSAAHSSRAGFWDSQIVDDTIKSIRLSASRKLEGGFFSAMSVGVNYAERTKDKNRFQNALYFKGTLTAGPYYEQVPDAYRRGIINTSFFGNPNGMINYDALSMFHDGFFNVIDARHDPLADGGTLNADITATWRMKEKLTTPYVKFDINSSLGSHALTGNIGLSAQRADQTAYLNALGGATVAQAVVSQVTDGAKYTEVLPSLNLALSLAEDLKLRFAAATTVSRPRMDDMAGGSTYTVIGPNTLPISFNGQQYYWSRNSGGNPRLKPWKANAYDLSLEKYFSNKAYFSAALFYKQLKRFLYLNNTVVSFNGALLPDQTTASDPTIYTNANANRLGVAQVLVNGSGGYIRGAELSGSLPGSIVANALDGFGLIFSASWTQSSVSPTPGTSSPVPGLSPRVINTTLYYEKYGFSARVSQRYREGFQGAVPTFDGSIQAQQVRSEALLDAQVGYEFQAGPAKGLSLNLSGTNLTDTPFALSNVGDNPYFNQKYEKYGAVYTLSATYKFF